MIGSTARSRSGPGAPADLRGFDGLSALVTLTLGEIRSPSCCLFVNATRKRAHVLLWDGTGGIYAERLERALACLWRDKRPAGATDNERAAVVS
jgi:hypothetical protein